MTTLISYPTNANDAYQDRLRAMGRRVGDYGVVRGELNEFLVTHVPGQLAVDIAAGVGVIDGIHGELNAPTRKSLATAHASLARIDRVVQVLQLGANPGPYQSVIEILPGSASASPQPPALRRSSTHIDLPIWQATVPAGATALLASNLTPDREWIGALPVGTYVPVATAVTGSNFGVSSSNLIGRFRFDGPFCHIEIAGTVALSGSNSGGFKVPLPCVARTEGIAVQLTAMNDGARGSTIDVDNLVTGAAYVDVYPLQGHTFPTDGVARGFSMNATLETAR